MEELYILTTKGERYMEQLASKMEDPNADPPSTAYLVRKAFILNEYAHGRTSAMGGFLARDFRQLVDDGYISVSDMESPRDLSPESVQKPQAILKGVREVEAALPNEDTEQGGVSNVPGLNESLFGNGA